MSRALTFSTVSGFAGVTKLAYAKRLNGFDTSASLVLYRADDADCRAFADSLAVEGMRSTALAIDPVRQWRDELAGFTGERGGLMLGMGNWADYLLARELARDSGLAMLMTLQHPLKAQQPVWARQHAGELLALNRLDASAGLGKVWSALMQRGSLQPDAPALFSWVIG